MPAFSITEVFGQNVTVDGLNKTITISINDLTESGDINDPALTLDSTEVSSWTSTDIANNTESIFVALLKRIEAFQNPNDLERNIVLGSISRALDVRQGKVRFRQNIDVYVPDTTPTNIDPDSVN